MFYRIVLDNFVSYCFVLLYIYILLAHMFMQIFYICNIFYSTDILEIIVSTCKNVCCMICLKGTVVCIYIYIYNIHTYIYTYLYLADHR